MLVAGSTEDLEEQGAPKTSRTNYEQGSPKMEEEEEEESSGDEPIQEKNIVPQMQIYATPSINGGNLFTNRCSSKESIGSRKSNTRKSKSKKAATRITTQNSSKSTQKKRSTLSDVLNQYVVQKGKSGTYGSPFIQPESKYIHIEKGGHADFSNRVTHATVDSKSECIPVSISNLINSHKSPQVLKDQMSRMANSKPTVLVSMLNLASVSTTAQSVHHQIASMTPGALDTVPCEVKACTKKPLRSKTQYERGSMDRLILNIKLQKEERCNGNTLGDTKLTDDNVCTINSLDGVKNLSDEMDLDISNLKQGHSGDSSRFVEKDTPSPEKDRIRIVPYIGRLDQLKRGGAYEKAPESDRVTKHDDDENETEPGSGGKKLRKSNSGFYKNLIEENCSGKKGSAVLTGQIQEKVSRVMGPKGPRPGDKSFKIPTLSKLLNAKFDLK